MPQFDPYTGERIQTFDTQTGQPIPADAEPLLAGNFASQQPTSINGQPPASPPGCCPCGGKGCSPCRGSIACLSVASTFMSLHLAIAVMGIAGGIDLIDNPDDDVELRLGLYDLIIFGVSTAGSLTSVVAGCVAACATSERVVRSSTIAVLVGSIIAFLVQMTLAILDAVAGNSIVYWTNVWTILAFVTSLFSVGLSTSALVMKQ